MSTDDGVQAARSPAADPHDGQTKSLESDSARLVQEIEARLQLHLAGCDRCAFAGGICDDARLLRTALTQLRASAEREGRLRAFREMIEKFQVGTQPKNSTKNERLGVAVAQGVLAVMLAEFDKAFPLDAALQPAREPETLEEKA